METWNDEYRMGEPAAVYQVAEVKERVNPETPLLEKGDEIIDMGADFDFDGFQVVRREFFAHLAEPAVTFNNCRFYVNSACLNKFPDPTLYRCWSIGTRRSWLCVHVQKTRGTPLPGAV